MSITRIYQPVELAESLEVSLDENASHHLARVLRAAIGDAVILFNGQGGEYHAVITAINKKNVSVKISGFNPREAESPVQIHLAQGIARGEKMDFIMQKAVELGVTDITPLITERCNVKLDRAREEKRWQHWQSIIISACEQSGRNRVPKLHATQSLQNWLPSVKDEKRFVLSPVAAEKLSVHKINESVVILIGPEGGLSQTEISLAERQGFLPLNLGPRILRTETASIAAISVLQNVFGDF